MEIISHRGYWNNENEKNSVGAFKKSFELGFGTETDVRDYDGKLVISHDISNSSSLRFTDFLDIYKMYSINGTLAINIKSDGLQNIIREELTLKNIKNYFLFDMSIPDLINSIDFGLKTFARYSEFEPENSIWKQCDGIWYDLFKSEELNLDLICSILENGNRVCIVSSELHSMNHIQQWGLLKTIPKKYFDSSDLILCTDLPVFAKEFFHAN